ncbi:MAG: hypothetical protein C4617_03850 [Candidatus Liberibacter europaeus]|uniref:Uncharacterized protein n=1 Tax=Candidatus Liberibacter europaeus TaxID=744859 RepID=A0A2T4VX48_9HYPH|nr:hypothetical protein [Candidatus Liberibacter europaeus]PTL86347.1 MAG: hypothetical protein C4617_03850 [Candidatus Liberibacter europaeus]
MTSKGEKRRKKKSIGRPCKKEVARTDSGRISRSKKTTLSPEVVAKEARMRLFGLSALQAAQAEGGSRIGRLRLTGKISSEQYQAFVCFTNQYRQYMKTLQVADSLERSGEYSRKYTYSEEADIKRRLAIKKNWMYLKKHIDEAQAKSSCNLWKSLDYFLTRDDGIMYSAPLNLTADLCRATDVLISYYGIIPTKQELK